MIVSLKDFGKKRSIVIALCYSSYSMLDIAGKEITSMVVISCGNFLKLANFGLSIKLGI